MSASARALCQIIEARPFISLTSRELGVLHFAVSGLRVTQRPDPIVQDVLGRLDDEIAHRRAFARGERRAYGLADTALDDALPRRERGYPVASRPWPTEKGVAAAKEGETP